MRENANAAEIYENRYVVLSVDFQKVFDIIINGIFSTQLVKKLLATEETFYLEFV